MTSLKNCATTLIAVALLLQGTSATNARATCADSIRYATDYDALSLGALSTAPNPAQDNWYAALREGEALAEIQDGLANPGRALFLDAPLGNPTGLQTIASRALPLADLAACPTVALSFDFRCTTSDLAATNLYNARVNVSGGPHPGYSIIELSLVSGNGTPKSLGIDVVIPAFDPGSQNNIPVPLVVGQGLAWDEWHSVVLTLGHMGDQLLQLTVDGQSQDLTAWKPPRTCDGGICNRGQLAEKLSVEVVPMDDPQETLDGLYVDNISFRAGPAPVGTSHKLALVYALPTDIAYDPAVHAELKRATADMQAWYQCASGGLTWELAYPDTVAVYYGQQERLYYVNNGNWWGSLLGEMASAGLPVWSPGTVLGIWAHGAGWWAGGAQACAGECGVALLGVELFPEFNNPSFSDGNCPGGSGVAAFPCTPLGAYAHELGHTLGLAHPDGVPETMADAPHSIMQTHWNYPNFAGPSESPWGFLSLERQTLLANPFMKWNVDLHQTYAGCDVVNLPGLGGSPVAAFSTTSSYLNKFQAVNLSTGAAYSYWMFGDGGVTNDPNPTHFYTTSGPRVVTLRVMATNGLVDTTTSYFVPTGVTVSAPRAPLALRATPNPFSRATTVTMSLASSDFADLSVYSVSGRRIKTLYEGVRSAGMWTVPWDGLDDRGVLAPSGVYFIRLKVGYQSLSRRVAVVR